MSDLFGNHIVGFPMRRLILFDPLNFFFRPINDLTHCIIEKLHKAAGYRCDRNSVMEVLFSNDTQRQQLVSRLGRDFSNKTTTRERLWLDVIQRYSRENCLG